MPRPRLAVLAVAATLVTVACSSDTPEDAAAPDAAEGDTETFTFGPERTDPDEVRPPSEPVELDPSLTDLSDEAPDLDACAVLTADEVGSILEVAVEALPNDRACAYTVDGQAIALLEVVSPAAAAARFEELAAGGPGRAPVAAADVGDAALLVGPPEERIVVVTGDAGFEVGSSSGNLGWTPEQLTGLARALVD